MSEGMIIRRGGGGGGFDPTGAILKVVTSAGCTVNVSGTSYSRTQTDADGFPRSDDANVVEHFFSIPSTAFGTITVTASKVYSGETLTATKTATVNTAGKVYEVLIAAPNILLNSTFGLQSGLVLNSGFSYSERYKEIKNDNMTNNWRKLFTNDIPVTAFDLLSVNLSSYSSEATGTIGLLDEDNVILSSIGLRGSRESGSDAIENKHYPTASVRVEGSLTYIYEIVLS